MSSVSRAVQEIAQGIGCILLLIRQNVSVYVDGDLDTLVSESLSDDIDGNAGAKQ